MSLQIASINSGSNGNCYYVGNASDAVLIDVGISCREVERRMAARGLDIKRVKAVFVSHEHSDHIRGLVRLSNKYSLPVYLASQTTMRPPFSQLRLHRYFCHGQEIAVGALSVVPFSKMHDAEDPHSFVVSSHGITVGVITDVGEACSNVVNYFGRCHAAFLESNYDHDMLMNGRYPVFLKERISSRVGHLSNAQAVDLFVKHRPPFMTHLLLSHLSKENNSPELAAAAFRPHAGNVSVVVASRYEASGVFTIGTNISASPEKQCVQLKLFAQS